MNRRQKKRRSEGVRDSQASKTAHNKRSLEQFEARKKVHGEMKVRKQKIESIKDEKRRKKKTEQNHKRLERRLQRLREQGKI